jgi:thiosulfate dehydrogenase
MIVDDDVITLTERINGCMRQSLNGKDLPDESREMAALIAYFRYIGKGPPRACGSPAWG